MAAEMGVSLRTVKRDVEFMLERLNLPIEYDARKYGFHYTREVEKFPALSITEGEMFALLVAHKAIAAKSLVKSKGPGCKTALMV